MKTGKPLYLFLIVLLAGQVFARDQIKHQFHFSLTLSGHILFGAGYTYWLNDEHAFEATVYPLLLPGKGFPFAVSAGYGFYPGGEHLKAKVGGEMTLLISPPDPERRKNNAVVKFYSRSPL
jgi:hypothetical protein